MAEPSLTQMQLVSSQTFLRRVTYLSWDEAERVLAGARDDLRGMTNGCCWPMQCSAVPTGK